MLRNKKGFTLIELMIVIAIIAILASILVPNFLKARAQGQLASCESSMKNEATALEMYATDNSGRYPAAATTLTTGTSPYMKSLPSCPSANKTFTYSQASNPDNFTLICTGSNHTQAGAGANFPSYSPIKGLMTK